MKLWEIRNNCRENIAFFKFLRMLQANLFDVKNYALLVKQIRESLIERLKDLLEVEVTHNVNWQIVLCYLYRCIEFKQEIRCPEFHYDINLKRHISSKGWTIVSNSFDRFQNIFNLFVRKREFLILQRGIRIKWKRGYEFLPSAFYLKDLIELKMAEELL